MDLREFNEAIRGGKGSEPRKPPTIDGLARQLGYVRFRQRDLAQRVADDQAKFAALEERLKRLEIAIAVMLTHKPEDTLRPPP